MARQVLITPLSQLVGGARNEADKIDTALAEIYLTNQGRQVYGGGGITPDVVVEADLPPALIRDLYRYRVFFDFVIEYVGTEGGLDKLAVDDEILQAFTEFIPRSAAAKARLNQSETELRGLRTLASHSGWAPTVLSLIDSLEVAIEQQAENINLTAAMEPYIRAGLEREFSLRADGRRASLLVDLGTDPQVMEAVSLLRNPERFLQHLRGDGPQDN